MCTVHELMGGGEQSVFVSCPPRLLSSGWSPRCGGCRFHRRFTPPPLLPAPWPLARLGAKGERSRGFKGSHPVTWCRRASPPCLQGSGGEKAARHAASPLSLSSPVAGRRDRGAPCCAQLCRVMPKYKASLLGSSTASLGCISGSGSSWLPLPVVQGGHPLPPGWPQDELGAPAC